MDARCARKTKRVAQHACTVLPHAALRAPLRAHALNTAAVQICRSVPCGLCMRRKVRDRTCLGWEKKRNPNSPVPPSHSHLLPLAGLAGGRRCSSRRAPSPRPGHPATAACGQWSCRRMSAHGCRPGPRRLPARPARGGCWHGMPAAAAQKWIRECLNSDLS